MIAMNNGAWLQELAKFLSETTCATSLGGCSDAQLEFHERRLGQSLTPQMRQFYTRFNGLAPVDASTTIDIWPLDRMEVVTKAGASSVVVFADFLFCAVEYAEESHSGAILIKRVPLDLELAEDFIDFIKLYQENSPRLRWDGTSQW